MSEQQKAWTTRIRRKRKSSGLCITCGEPTDRLRCPRHQKIHRDYMREYMRKYRPPMAATNGKRKPKAKRKGKK